MDLKVRPIKKFNSTPLQMKRNINLTVIIGIFLLVIASFFFHELAHYLMGEALGYDMIMTMNTVNLADGQSYAADWQRQLVSAAGPIFTMITAIICFVFLSKKDHVYVYIILFIAFIQRFLAASVSLMNPNDEARISESLGLGTMTLPILVSIALFTLVYLTARKWKYSFKFSLISFFVISLSITALVLTDQFVIKPWVYS